MYTLTRKLSVVCLTVVLSFLVYGCGGSSKQALITEVSTDEVTAGLTPDPGTYTIQPGGTATAGDVTFACPTGGSSCEVTVADDGTIVPSPSAEGMATAMNSESAAARLVAVGERDAARMALTTAQTDLTTAEGERDAARMALTTAQTDLTTAEGERDAARMALTTAQTDLTTAEGERDAARMALTTAQTDLTTAEGERDAARMALTTAQTDLTTTEGERDAARMALTTAQTDLTTAEGERDAARMALTTAQTDLTTAEGERDTARMALTTAQTDLTTTEGQRDAALQAQMDAEDALAAEKLKFAQIVDMVNDVELNLASGYDAITPDTYIIQAGAERVVDDVNFVCPEGDLPCVVIVTPILDENGDVAGTNVMSLGGAATGGNTMAVMNTRAAIALTATDLGLNSPAVVAEAPVPSVTRNTDGSVTTIMLTHNVDDDSDDVEYTREEVDPDHAIDGWDGQTLKRGDTEDLPASQRATVYTNIDQATRQKLKYGGDDEAVPTPGNLAQFVLGPGQGNDESINMARSFTGAYGSIFGTFTCADDATNCGTVETDDTGIGGERLLLTTLDSLDWTFVSDDYVESESTQDEDYMFFGYWLQSPQNPSAPMPQYMFAAFHGGGSKFSVVNALSTNGEDEGLTATYEGGAAGRYVTRKQRTKDDAFDPQSPGYHGRFTATATLTADFGTHPDFEADEDTDRQDTRNMIQGTITDFRDGATTDPLGFEVTLGLTSIGDGDFSGTTTATFSDTETSTGSTTGTGTWSGQFYGPAAAEATDDMPAEDASTKLPSGVAGLFDASSAISRAKVIGAFAAAEEKQ